MEDKSRLEFSEGALPEGLPNRVVHEITYYASASRRHLRRFQRYKIIQIVAGSLIPVASLMAPDGYVRPITAVLGALVAGIESYLQFRQYQQNWIRWRTTAETLKREAFLYAQNAGPYTNADKRDLLLAENVEQIIAGEQQSWRSLQERPKAHSS